jgi:ABC-2 type transport system permease protein
MSAQSNTMPESPVATQTIAPVAVSHLQLLYWSLRRELWENRSLYLAPLAVAAVFLFGFLLSLIHLSAKMRAAAALSPSHQYEAIMQPYSFVAMLLMGTTLIVAIFYCLDALHGERRDRSILFWKSLPVSDLMTVLSKAIIPVVVLPLITFAITVATHWIMLLLDSVILLRNGLSVATLSTHLSLFQFALFTHLLGFHGFWYAPIFAWLLIVSAWARRATFLWAALPLLAIGVIEKIALNTSYFASLLEYRLTGGPPNAAATGISTMEGMIQSVPADFLMSPGLWVGLALAAAFLAGAARLRRYQTPI